jgi:putative oxidoreductase
MGRKEPAPTGLLTPVAAAMVSVVMFTAIWTAHLAKGVWLTEGGYEYNLVLLAAVFAVSAIGPGAWSLDDVLGLDVAGTGWALAELAAGALGATIAVAAGRASARRGVHGPHPAGRG